MATAHIKAATRAPVRARPRADVDVKEIADGIADRFSETFKYLAR